MKKIRLTESQLHRVIKESVKNTLIEQGLWNTVKGAFTKNKTTQQQNTTPAYTPGPTITWKKNGTEVYFYNKYAGNIEQTGNGQFIGYIPYIGNTSDGTQEFHGTDLNQIKQEMENFIKQNEDAVYNACEDRAHNNSWS